MDKKTLNKFESLQKLIGNTPLAEIECTFDGQKRFVRAKLESFNFSGSIKDRPALFMLKSAYMSGSLLPGQTICETTSGNMGISICAIAGMLKNPVVVCMPKSMSVERQELIKLLGAKLELFDNFEQAFKKSEEYGKRGAFLTEQFKNINNVRAHFETAKEILLKHNEIPCFVSGVGTGGTLMGVGRVLKEKCNSKVIAVDPQESNLLVSGKSLGHHKIQGLSDEIIPEIYNEELVDKIISVKSDDAIAMSRKISMQLGLSVGISSGANFIGCLLSGFNRAVTVFADDGKKYLSTDLIKETKSELANRVELISYKIL